MKNNNNTTTTDIFIYSCAFANNVHLSFLDDDETNDDIVNLPGDLSNDVVKNELEMYSIKWRRKSLEYLSRLKKEGFVVRPCFKKEVTIEKGSRRRIIRYFCNFHDDITEDDVGCLVLYISKAPTTSEYIRECICGIFN